MSRIAFLVSSARAIDLRAIPQHPTGYWAEEALKAYERFDEAGIEVVVITPDGNAPTPDPYSLEPMFHYPEQDTDFFASVHRTFERDPEDIRITLAHRTVLELVASRRIVLRLIDAGMTARDARDLVCEAAKVAWQQ